MADSQPFEKADDVSAVESSSSLFVVFLMALFGGAVFAVIGFLCGALVFAPPSKGPGNFDGIDALFRGILGGALAGIPGLFISGWLAQVCFFPERPSAHMRPNHSGENSNHS